MISFILKHCRSRMLGPFRTGLTLDKFSFGQKWNYGQEIRINNSIKRGAIFLFFLFSGFFFHRHYLQFQDELIKKTILDEKIQKTIEKCSKIKFQEETYVDSPLYGQVKKFIDEVVKDQQIKIVVGASLNGKSTLIKKVLSDMKKQGQQVYYFCCEGLQYHQQSRWELYNLLSGLEKKYRGNDKFKGKKVKVVFDSINLIQKNNYFKQVMQDIYSSANSCLDIICLSTESRFVRRQQEDSFWKPFCKKYSKILIMQDCPEEQTRNFQMKIIYQLSAGKINKIIKEGKQIDHPIAKLVADIGLANQPVIDLTKNIINQQDFDANLSVDEFMKILQKDTTKYLTCRSYWFYPQIDKIRDKQQKLQLISEILSLKAQKFDVQACNKIISQHWKTKSPIAQILMNLEKSQLLTFCKPTDKFQEKGLQKLYESYLKSN